MKKSEIYKEAAKAVVLSGDISASDKLEILKELFEEEKLALYCEKRDEQKESEAAENGEI